MLELGEETDVLEVDLRLCVARFRRHVAVDMYGSCSQKRRRDEDGVWSSEK